LIVDCLLGIGGYGIFLLESEKKAVLSGAMDDSAYLYGIVLDNVKDQIPVHNQHAVSKPFEPIIFWNNSKNGCVVKRSDCRIELIKL